MKPKLKIVTHLLSSIPLGQLHSSLTVQRLGFLDLYVKDKHGFTRRNSELFPLYPPCLLCHWQVVSSSLMFDTVVYFTPAPLALGNNSSYFGVCPHSHCGLCLLLKNDQCCQLILPSLHMSQQVYAASLVPFSIWVILFKVQQIIKQFWKQKYLIDSGYQFILLLEIREVF